MSRYRALLLALIVSVAMGGAEMAEKVRQQNREVVKQAAESLSRELPKRVDRYTQLMAIDADGEKLVYIFEVDAGPKSDEQLSPKGRSG